MRTQYEPHAGKFYAAWILASVIASAIWIGRNLF